MYDDKPLSQDMTLLDIAYIYAWRRVNKIISIIKIRLNYINLTIFFNNKVSTNATFLPLHR